MSSVEGNKARATSRDGTPAEWREIRDIAQMGFWELDLRSDELRWSEEIFDIFDVDPKDFGASYQTFLARVHPADRDYVDSSYRHSVDTRTPYDIVHRLLLRDGTVKWVHERGRTHYSDDGTPVRSIGTVTDITAVKALEEQLRHAQKMESLALLTSGIIHDINNFLTVIVACTDILAMSPPQDDYAREQIDQIRNAGRQCASLTRQLLAFSRRQKLDLHPLEIGPTIADSLPILQASLGPRVTIHFEDDSDGAVVRSDASQIVQVLINLGLNAKEAMPDGGELHISCHQEVLDSPEEDHRAVVRLRVRDTGDGMPPEVADQIFEPFFSTRSESGGTGLGLSVVQGIVEQHGGEISVASTPGEGTTFTIELPIWLDTERSLPIRLPGRAPERTVLFVGPSRASRRLVRGTLQPLGYHVLSATDADEARSLASRLGRLPALVILDATLADAERLRLAAGLRALQPDLPILFLGSSSRVGPSSPTSEDLDTFLSRRLLPSELASTVLRLLPRRAEEPQRQSSPPSPGSQ